MYAKNLPCLFNPTEDEILKREPLIAFSFYLNDKVNLLLSTADEIVGLLEEGFSKSIVNENMVGRASSLTWFWILGAYEVVRTMAQSKGCFSLTVQNKLITLKKELAEVRMPASKMEKQGKRIPVVSTRSPDGWDIENKDLWVNDPDEKIVSARYLFDRFHNVLINIERIDILKNHYENYV